MTQHSGARSPREDDERAHETAGTVQGGHGSRLEEHRDPQPPDEGEPVVGATTGHADRQAAPDGMTQDDVQRRSEVARFLGASAFPADRDALLRTARDNQATDEVLGLLGRLPDGDFENLQAVARAAGIGTEQERS